TVLIDKVPSTPPPPRSVEATTVDAPKAVIIPSFPEIAESKPQPPGPPPAPDLSRSLSLSTANLPFLNDSQVFGVRGDSQVIELLGEDMPDAPDLSEIDDSFEDAFDDNQIPPDALRSDFSLAFERATGWLREHRMPLPDFARMARTARAKVIRSAA